MASPIGSGPPPAGAPGPSGPAERKTLNPPQPAGPGTPVLLPDGWVATVTDRIVSTVDTVRAKTTVPIEKVGRMVVWGLLIATAGISLLVVLVIGGLRLLYEAVGNIPGISGREGRSVWIIDVLFGVVLILVGLLFIKKGTQPKHDD